MSALVKHLSRYADYHQTGHNVATHIVGIPLIIFGVTVLTSRPVIHFEAVALTPAMLISAAAGLFYLGLDTRLGIIMTALLALVAWAGLAIAQWPSTWWLVAGLGSFIVGWLFQIVGHYLEGKKPAFIDDVSGLIIGPIFVVAEIGFLCGLRLPLKKAMHDDAVSRGAIKPRDRASDGSTFS